MKRWLVTAFVTLAARNIRCPWCYISTNPFTNPETQDAGSPVEAMTAINTAFLVSVCQVLEGIASRAQSQSRDEMTGDASVARSSTILKRSYDAFGAPFSPAHSLRSNSHTPPFHA